MIEYIPLSSTIVSVKFKNIYHSHTWKQIKNINGKFDTRCGICGLFKSTNKCILSIQKNNEFNIGKAKAIIDKGHNIKLIFQTKEEKENKKKIIKKDYKKLWKDSIKYVIRKKKYNTLITVYKNWNTPLVKIEQKNHSYKNITYKIPKLENKPSWLLNDPYKITSDYIVVVPLNKRSLKK